jgi:ABC-2 type transport system permease protein
MKKYIRLWWIYTLRATQVAFTSRLGVVIFTLGKILRFGLFIFFLFLIVAKTKTLSGYSLWQVMFFYATFNFIDTTAQFFLRDVYRFRSHVVSGFFDTYLLKPMSPLFKALFGGSDVLDLSMLFLSIIFIIIAFQHFPLSLWGIVLYILLLVNSLLIALSFHIFVVGFGILTTEVDNMLWMYRDLTQMGRVPVDIYRQPIQWIITFFIPVGIMMTFPAKALFGLLTLPVVVFSLFIGIVFYTAAYAFWGYALKQYSSASS